MQSPSIVNFMRVVLGIKFRDEPVSTKTRERILSRNFIYILCKSLLWACASTKKSSLLYPIQLLEVTFRTTLSNWSTVISFLKWVVFRILISASLYALELNSKYRMDIFDGVWLSWSTTLLSPFLIITRNYSALSRGTLILDEPFPWSGHATSFSFWRSRWHIIILFLQLLRNEYSSTMSYSTSFSDIGITILLIFNMLILFLTSLPSTRVVTSYVHGITFLLS